MNIVHEYYRTRMLFDCENNLINMINFEISVKYRYKEKNLVRGKMVRRIEKKSGMFLKI